MDSQRFLADLEGVEEVELDKKLQAHTTEVGEVDVKLLDRLWHSRRMSDTVRGVMRSSTLTRPLQPTISLTVVGKELQLRIDHFTHLRLE